MPWPEYVKKSIDDVAEVFFTAIVYCGPLA